LFGTIKDRAFVREILADLPQSPVATVPEALAPIETAKLAGRGIGYVDAHLLASAKLAGALVWTRDKPLVTAANRLGVGFD
jgi:predicted nucleic acid-binding protein